MLIRGQPLTPAQALYIQGQIWVAPTVYDYCPVPMDEHLRKPALGDHQLLRRLGITLLLVVAGGVLVAMIIFAVRANTEACRDGLQAVQECRNVTHVLDHQLSRAQEVLRGAEAQAATCNQTVVTLRASLEMEKAHSREQLARALQLEEEMSALRQQLQNALAEAERLRKWNDDASGGNNDSASSLNGLSPLVVAVLLLLGLQALLR
ncbi:bone marrow stromal antigen 2 [Diceros bicornis minor]|uniref:bone marrow stromal antigen 2 n=1 Tax=Diceros bicornis minor TaxID=77932 RepID=UPI0026F18632|nr:bone marrow stromal antigen 2 [Diceros bicornis minor]